MKVFYLTHIREFSDGAINTKGIGFFKTEDECREVILSLLDQPGFRDYPNDFVIDEREVIGSEDTTMLSKVYHVTHECECDDEDEDEAAEGYVTFVTDIGVYATLELAEEAVRIAELDPKFANAILSDVATGFCIDECPLGEVGWSEGFVPWSD